MDANPKDLLGLGTHNAQNVGGAFAFYKKFVLCCFNSHYFRLNYISS